MLLDAVSGLFIGGPSRCGCRTLHSRCLRGRVEGSRLRGRTARPRPGHCATDMGGPDAPRTVAQGADTGVWLATRASTGPDGEPVETGRRWEDRRPVPW